MLCLQRTLLPTVTTYYHHPLIATHWHSHFSINSPNYYL